jgi:hypothetical protein
MKLQRMTWRGLVQNLPGLAYGRGTLTHARSQLRSRGGIGNLSNLTCLGAIEHHPPPDLLLSSLHNILFSSLLFSSLVHKIVFSSLLLPNLVHTISRFGREFSVGSCSRPKRTALWWHCIVTSEGERALWSSLLSLRVRILAPGAANP